MPRTRWLGLGGHGFCEHGVFSVHRTRLELFNKVWSLFRNRVRCRLCVLCCGPSRKRVGQRNPSDRPCVMRQKLSCCVLEMNTDPTPNPVEGPMRESSQCSLREHCNATALPVPTRIKRPRKHAAQRLALQAIINSVLGQKVDTRRTLRRKVCSFFVFTS